MVCVLTLPSLVEGYSTFQTLYCYLHNSLTVALPSFLEFFFKVFYEAEVFGMQERVIEQLNCTSFIEQTLALGLGAAPAKPSLLYM